MAVMPFLTFQYKGIQEFLHLAENLQIILNSGPLKLLLCDSGNSHFHEGKTF